MATDDRRQTSLAAECVLIQADGAQRVVMIETHADAHKVLGGPCEVAFYLGSDAAAMCLKNPSAGMLRNIVAELAHREIVGGLSRILGPVLFVGMNTRSGALETLPGEWRKPLTEWGKPQ